MPPPGGVTATAPGSNDLEQADESPGDGRSRPVTGAAPDVEVLTGDNDSPQSRRTDPSWHVPGQGVLVIGRTGRWRLVVTVLCPACEHRHAHTAPPSFTSGIRAAGCGRGRYRVVVSLSERQVAA